MKFFYAIALSILLLSGCTIVVEPKEAPISPPQEIIVEIPEIVVPTVEIPGPVVYRDKLVSCKLPTMAKLGKLAPVDAEPFKAAGDPVGYTRALMEREKEILALIIQLEKDNKRCKAK